MLGGQDDMLSLSVKTGSSERQFVYLDFRTMTQLESLSKARVEFFSAGTRVESFCSNDSSRVESLKIHIKNTHKLT